MNNQKLRFGDIAKLRREIVNPKNIEKTNYLGLEHINQESLTINSVGTSTGLESNKYVFSSGNVLFGKLRPYFRKVYQPKFDGVCSTDIWVVEPKDKDVTPSKFLFYLMAHTKFVNYVNRGSTGTRMPRADWSHAKNYQIKNFTFEQKNDISNFLSSLDDKIEINQKINQTLEEIAKTLFQSWFIDFDPVRAKAEGRPTGLPEEISDLFSNSFEDSELGEIPKGWEVLTVGKIFKVLLGGTPSRNKVSYWNGDIPWINSGAVNNFRVIEPVELITQDGFSNSSTKLLPKRSTLIAITGATLGQISLNEIDVSANQSVVGIIPSEIIPPEFTYLWMKSSVHKLISSQTGGAQQHINTNNVKDHLILKPNKEILVKFSELVKPNFDKITNNLFEEKTLESQRDTLLPKFILGELRISDAEKLIEEVSA